MNTKLSKEVRKSIAQGQIAEMVNNLCAWYDLDKKDISELLQIVAQAITKPAD